MNASFNLACAEIDRVSADIWQSEQLVVMPVCDAIFKLDCAEIDLVRILGSLRS